MEQKVVVDRKQLVSLCVTAAKLSASMETILVGNTQGANQEQMDACVTVLMEFQQNQGQWDNMVTESEFILSITNLDNPGAFLVYRVGKMYALVVV